MKIFRGKVVGVKNKKTAIVEVERFFAHPLYLKRTRKTKRYPVHDETGVKEGNIVDFAQTRPISKTKRWKIIKILSGTKKEKIKNKSEKLQSKRKKVKAKSKKKKIIF